MVAVITLLIGVRSVSEPRENIARVWESTNVACLPFGHQNLAQHIHPHLSITVNGVNEPVAANVGVDQTCMAELHTHDASGEIHIETVVPGKSFTLIDFFSVLGRPIERDGYSYQVFANGEPIDPEAYALQDLDSIELQYVAN